MIFSIKFLIRIYFYSIFCISLKQCQKCCLNSSVYTSTFSRIFISIYNFKRFDELEFNCQSPVEMLYWEISPSKQLILNDDLDLTGLKIKLGERYLHLRFNNLKGKYTHSYIWLRKFSKILSCSWQNFCEN